MIKTNYPLPFIFETTLANPWDGRLVDMVVHGGDVREVAAHLEEAIRTFRSLAKVGGLAGTARAPWLPSCGEPAFGMLQAGAHVQFHSCILDERATHCLICLLLALHNVAPFTRVTLAVPGSNPHIIDFQPEITDPYPQLWPQLPFPYFIEESESEDRLLRARFAADLNGDQVATVHRGLMHWASAAAAGAYGVAPIDPRSCDCLASNPVEHYKDEVIWAIEKCRFHYAALRALVAVCATVHHRIERLVDLAIE